ncbi:hypothetical protein K435DRAFT_794477 [Dendrothele bispora CBS 962.96]|uniref:Uncharacterized protein n=1 Tax=Dendrothele bispora (strain CBS 962.96) TaxID=1314807 RepID=A0A4S8MC45_DENBC|nr:hypothetical protein K435DRAFT_794477 [Dendrothele bispora CBS 962.96]
MYITIYHMVLLASHLRLVDGDKWVGYGLGLFLDAQSSPTMSSVTADSPDTVDNAIIVQNNQAGGSAASMTNVDCVPGPLASSGISAKTVTQEEDTQALRNVSPGTRTSITVAQSMQMFNRSSQTEFINSVLSNVGGNKNETHNVYHIYGYNPNIYCSSTDLGALHINSIGSPEVRLRGATPSRPEQVNHGDMNTLATSTALHSVPQRRKGRPIAFKPAFLLPWSPALVKITPTVPVRALDARRMSTRLLQLTKTRLPKFFESILLFFNLE